MEAATATTRAVRPSNVLPDAEEAARIVLPSDSPAHDVTGDIRLYFASGYALLMQVSHPTVGAGVRDHSTFAEDPWGRLMRTMDYLYLITLTGPESANVGRRVRELHKTIKGTNPDGSKYHALEPEAYAWVHATLIEATVRGRRKFVGPMSRYEVDAFYDAWMPLGRLLGVRPGDLPTDWDGFRDYFATISHDTLERNETVDKVIRTMAAKEPPPVPGMKYVWPVLRLAPARAVKVSTIGMLRQPLRDRFGLPWTRRDMLDMRMMMRTSRALSPVLPKSMMRDFGHRHLEWRRKEIAAGPLGPGADQPGGCPVQAAA
jgi:uncharacterized protein (DUF2236 family)